MIKKEKLFSEIKQLEVECNQILEGVKISDKTHGWTWFFLVFGVIPIFFIILSYFIFDIQAYQITKETLAVFFNVVIILIAIFFFTKHKSAEEYDKLFVKQRRLYSLQILLKNSTLESGVFT